MKTNYLLSYKKYGLFLFPAMAIFIFSLTGCGATRYYLKNASLKDEDPHAEILYDNHIPGVSWQITRVFFQMAEGKMQEDPIIDKDSMAKNAGKFAFSWTPLGMMVNALDTKNLAVCVPPGKIDLLIEMNGVEKVITKSKEGETNTITLVSSWNYRIPAIFEAARSYTAVYDGNLIIKDEKGSVVGRSDPKALLPVSQNDEKAFLLSKADREMAEEGRNLSREMGVAYIPVYGDSNGIFVVMSGSIDLGRIASGLSRWIPDNSLLVNVGYQKFSIDRFMLEQGDCILNRSGQYIKKTL